MKKRRRSRENEIEAIRKTLLFSESPRLYVTVILILTALTGFLTSFSLLHLGVSSMVLRYPIAIAVAYCFFLLLLRVWLWLRTNPDCDFSADFSGSSSSDFGSETNFEFGGGGDFGGGGAGGNWGDGAASSFNSDNSSVFDGLSFDLDFEELGLVILAIVALVGGVLASLYVIYISPVLLAEILVDGALAAGLYSRFKNIERKYWLKSAVKRTILPAVLSLLFFTIAGFALQKAAPEADSIGAVWSQMKSEKNRSQE